MIQDMEFIRLNYFLNRDFYPALLEYQSESVAAEFVNKSEIDVNELYIFFPHEAEKFYNCTNNVWALDFYLNKTLPQVNEIENLSRLSKIGIVVFTKQQGYEEILKAGINHQIVKVFDDFHVTTLNPTFINKNTREASLSKSYLIELDK